MSSYRKTAAGHVPAIKISCFSVSPPYFCLTFCRPYDLFASSCRDLCLSEYARRICFWCTHLYLFTRSSAWHSTSPMQINPDLPPRRRHLLIRCDGETCTCKHFAGQYLTGTDQSPRVLNEAVSFSIYCPFFGQETHASPHQYEPFCSIFQQPGGNV